MRKLKTINGDKHLLLLKNKFVVIKIKSYCDTMWGNKKYKEKENETIIIKKKK